MSDQSDSALGQAWHAHVVGRDDSAVEEFRKLAEKSPNDVDVLYGFGLALRGAGQKEEALAVFNRLLEILQSVNPESDDEANRLEMLTRMVNQQIEIAQRSL